MAFYFGNGVTATNNNINMLDFFYTHVHFQTTKLSTTEDVQLNCCAVADVEQRPPTTHQVVYSRQSSAVADVVQRPATTHPVVHSRQSSAGFRWRMVFIFEMPGKQIVVLCVKCYWSASCYRCPWTESSARLSAWICRTAADKVKEEIMQVARSMCQRLEDNPYLLSSASSFVKQAH